MDAVALPFTTAKLFGPESFSDAFGVIFTAWGAAGVLSPIVAGRLFDLTGNYRAAVLVAAAAALGAALAAAGLPSGADDDAAAA